MDFLIGTMGGNGGPGIARVRLTQDSLACLWQDPVLSDPNWLSLGPDGRIFAVSRNMPEPGTDCINELELTPSGMRLLSSQPTGGSDPCHIGFSDDNHFLFTANYGSGSLTVFPLAEKPLGPRIQLIQHEGHGLHPTRQTAPHVHQVLSLPHLPGYLCASDLGIDALVVYKQNRKTGILTRRYQLCLPPGEGPRHLACAKNGDCWLATELGNKIYRVSFYADHGSLSGGISTLESAQSENTAAAIRISDDTRYAYVSNRGEDSIAVFSLHPLQKTTVWRHVGKTPRDFILLDHNRALVACQGEGLNLLENGHIIASLSLPGSVCVLPLP